MARIVEKKDAYENIFVARQPIFSRKREITGYELLFRSSGTAGRAAFPDEDVASSKVMVDGFSLAANNVSDEKRFFINFTRSMLLNETALALPPERCVIEVLEDVLPVPEVLAACKALRERGYSLALDDYAGEPQRDPFLGLVDLVKVDIRRLAREKWGSELDRLRDFGAKVVAEKVETWEEFEELQGLGYDFFQGYFFSRPEIVPGRKLSSGMLAKVKLLKVLGDSSAGSEEIPDIIQSDPGLSLRLLKFINSAAFGFRSKITSIRHAVTLLGLEPLRRWAMVVVISDMDASFKGEELTFISLQRARFLELLAEAAESAPLTSGGLFLLGLLSRVDAMLGLTMREVLGDLILEEGLMRALQGEPCPARQWLEMIEALERGDWKHAGGAVAEWGLSGGQAARCYLQASSWASEKMWALRQQ